MFSWIIRDGLAVYYVSIKTGPLYNRSLHVFRSIFRSYGARVNVKQAILSEGVLMKSVIM